MLMAVATAAAAVAVTVTRVASSFPSPSRPPVAMAPLPPTVASYLGVYEKGPPRTYQPVAEFAGGGQGAEPRRVLQRLGRALRSAVRRRAQVHGAVTIVQMDPTYASIPVIATGGYDSYLRSYADGVRNFGHAVVIGVGQ